MGPLSRPELLSASCWEKIRRSRLIGSPIHLTPVKVLGLSRVFHALGTAVVSTTAK